MGFTFVLLIILVIYVLKQLSSLSTRIKNIESEIIDIKWRAFKEKQPLVDKDKPKQPDKVEPGSPTRADIVMGRALADQGSKPEKLSSEPITTPQQVSVQEESKIPAKKSEFAEKLKHYENLFARYWIGILGAIILVMGVSFLGIYAALQCTPFVRFLMILLTSGVLIGLYSFLRTKPVYLNLALWLRSSAGALFLFACLGAGGIKAIQWIDNPYHALFVLMVGIAANLYLGYIGGTQLYSSLHVFISLVALAIAPQNNIIFISASVVTLFGVAMSYKERWEYNLLATISAFFIYHCYWVFALINNTGIQRIHHYTGIFSVIIISITALLIHYREIYKTISIDKFPALVHFFNWMYFGVGVYMHSLKHPLKPLLIFLGAIAAFIIARKGKKAGIRWVYVMDTLVAQVVTLIAILSITQWEIAWYLIAGIMFLECLVYTYVVLEEDEQMLGSVGMWIASVIGMVIAVSLFFAYGRSDFITLVKHSTVAAVCALFGMGFHITFVKRYKEVLDSFSKIFVFLNEMVSTVPVKKPDEHISSLGIILTLFVFSGYFALQGYVWSIYCTASILILFIYLRQKYQLNGLGLGLLITLIGTSVVGWQSLQNMGDGQIIQKLMYAMPFLAVSLYMVPLSYIAYYKQNISWFGIYMFIAHIMVCTYIIFNPVSSFIPAVIWLILSVIIYELSRYFEQSTNKTIEELNLNKHVYWAGIVLLAAFIVRHILVHLQSELFIGFMRMRLAIGLSGIAVLFYWYFSRKPQGAGTGIAEKTAHTLLIESIILFSALTVGIEADNRWRPVLWIVCALICLMCGMKWSSAGSRLKLYSLFFAWASAFHIAFVSGQYITPSNKWVEQAWFGGIAALLLQAVYLYFVFRKNIYSDIKFPFLTDFFAKITGAIQGRRYLWVSYPVFIAIAVFFYFSFDKSILTVLYVLECFGIFILSIMLIEPHFRNLSMGGLMLCLVRLVFYDLSHSGTLMRAVVFISVGGIMLLMNFIYTKYSGRRT